ncbi:hypothetical protein FQA39_LY14684 [Lamprigera yunnana]|nr:hypothetical protein FQA39_LY14684 [Lamprigera yunnana]
MTKREYTSSKHKWKIVKKKSRERQKTAQAILVETPVSTPYSGTPISLRSREDTLNQPPERNDLEDIINKYLERNGLKTMNDEEVLTNISNIVGDPNKTYLEMVSSPPSTDDVSLSKFKPEKEQEAMVSNRHELDLI